MSGVEVMIPEAELQTVRDILNQALVFSVEWDRFRGAARLQHGAVPNSPLTASIARGMRIVDKALGIDAPEGTR